MSYATIPPRRRPLPRSMLSVALCLTALAAPAAALQVQSQPPAPAVQLGAPAGQSREQTWFAPTAADWQRPCLVHWQRTWEDAQAVSKETGKPILVCVNMDGEIASEHYAGVRYRQPEIAALYEGYVCVIGSVYRHTPRDHDEQGRRILCPRFGSVTCGEHIAMEGRAYAQFLDGERVAPRHIGVDPEAAAAAEAGGADAGAIHSELFDVYYAYDTQSVFNAVSQGLGNWKRPIVPLRGDLSLPELVAAPDQGHRERVEALYSEGDSDLRRHLLEAALAQGGAAPLELLRLAVFGADPELAALARRALAQSSSPAAADVIIEALELPLAQAEQQALIDALTRLGASSPRARTIAQARTGLAGPSSVDVAGWSAALSTAQASYAAAAARPQHVARLTDQNAILSSADGAAHLELAEAMLALAEDEPDPRSARWLYVDAQNAARQAESLGAGGPRNNSVLALAALSLGETEEADKRIDAGVASVPAVPGSASAMRMLEQFAQSRQEAIAQAVRENKEWPTPWLADVDGAYEVLVRHPDGTDQQALMHYDFINWFGAATRAAQILDEGLERFPGSADLHDRLRARLLRTRGVAGLESEYEQRLTRLAVRPDATPQAVAELESFAGYASLVAAEFHRRQGQVDTSRAAYDRAIRHYECASADDAGQDETSDHYIALALAGRARLALERGDEERALEELLSCFARKPDAAATLDGLNVSAVDTANMLAGRLREHDDVARLEVLQTALDGLDPEMLLPPAYERGEPGERPAARPSRPPVGFPPDAPQSGAR